MPVNGEMKVELEIVFETCYTCGLPVAMTKNQQKECTHNGKSWICAMGHHTVRKIPEVDRLKTELAKAQEMNNSLVSQRQTLVIEKQVLERKLDEAAKEKTRIIKRANAGVCPHCQRTVSQMARHIKTKHGDMPALGEQST